MDAAGRPVGTRKPFAASPFHESTAAISTDGRWVAYESDELDGVVQVYVRSWPDGAHKVRASSGGARLPAWGPGGELYYWQTGENMLRVIHTRESGGQLTIGAAASAVAGRRRSRGAAASRDHRAELRASTSIRAGARFLVLEKATADSGPDLKSPIVVMP